ncbi:MAG: hypothetical protein JNL97_08020 [Verrucomicrobiales bacterium]|nr:hypothetical protein [Verrucomicrobiales bacterium]
MNNAYLMSRPALLAMLLVTSSCATPLRTPDPSQQPPAAALAPMPEAVTSFGAVSHQGWMYVFGGHKGERHEYSAAMVSGAFHRIRLSEGSGWEKLPNGTPAQGVALVAHGNHAYRIGGMAARNAPGEKSDLHSHATVSRYDIGKGVWEDFVPLPQPRSSHDAVVLDDAIYVAGGWALSGSSSKGVWANTLLKLDLRASQPRWEALPQPFQRRAVALAGPGHRLFCLGGIDTEGSTLLAVDVYDIASGTWSKGPDLPAGPMKGFGCSAIGQAGRIYFSGMKGDLHALDPFGAEWSFVASLRNPRFFHRLVPAGTAHLVAAGGEDSEGKRNDLEILPVLAAR